MKKIAKHLAIIGLFGAAGFAKAEVMDITPFAGIDYYQPWMKANTDWNLIFPSSTYPGVSFYVGTRFHENFGVELGYDWSFHRFKNWTLPQGSTFFNSPVTNPGGLSGETKIVRTGGHLDFIGFLPIADCFELMGSLGFGWVQPKIHMTFNSNPGSSATSSALASTTGKGRGVFRVGFGGNYMLTEDIGVRAKIGWESTSTLRVSGNATFQTLGYREKAFKGTTAFSVGVFTTF